MVYSWSTRKYNKFKDQGITGPKAYPIFGSAFIVFQKVGLKLKENERSPSSPMIVSIPLSHWVC